MNVHSTLSFIYGIINITCNHAPALIPFNIRDLTVSCGIGGHNVDMVMPMTDHGRMLCYIVVE